MHHLRQGMLFDSRTSEWMRPEDAPNGDIDAQVQHLIERARAGDRAQVIGPRGQRAELYMVGDAFELVYRRRARAAANPVIMSKDIRQFIVKGTLAKGHWAYRQPKKR